MEHNINLTRKLLLEIGINPDNILKKLKEQQVKTIEDCLVYRKLKEAADCSVCSNCPYHAQHESILESS